GHYLQALAILHFKDWLEEREQAIPENYQEPEIDPSIRPTQENMRSTRADILSWRRPARSEELSFKSTTEKFRWQQMRAIERRIADGEPIQGRPRSKQPLWFIYTAIGVLLVVLAYIAFDFRSRAQAPQQVYESNFNPPNSIVNDLQRLQQADSSIQEGSSPCLERLKAADKPYQQQQFSAAAEILEEIADNESSADCQSDALFYLAIIALQRDQPTVTLQCLAKIDNIERYGEDLYWYQALAFVKIAAKNPDLREKAAGAVERARSNTSDPKRRNQAEKMLKELVEQ
ncbi:MAG: hypothetical protein KGS48_02595, partial [Bacteroidetes bacterium]|nr:hypothetical protein [Bacteroidota bacterium]